jgi:hypothetical protein
MEDVVIKKIKKLQKHLLVHRSELWWLTSMPSSPVLCLVEWQQHLHRHRRRPAAT